jgi:hypothetical protein
MVAALSARGPGGTELFADAEEIESATRVATEQLNRRAKPWGYGVVLRNHGGIVEDLFLQPLRNGAIR